MQRIRLSKDNTPDQPIPKQKGFKSDFQLNCSPLTATSWHPELQSLWLRCHCRNFPQGWFGRINLHAGWFNGHTIDSPICYTKANSADLPWFSQHFRWVFARFFSMSGLSVRFFEGHFLVLEFTTLEFGSSFG